VKCCPTASCCSPPVTRRPRIFSAGLPPPRILISSNGWNATPALIERAVEEGLRYCSPVQGLFRRVHADTRPGGTTIPAGSQVWVSYGATNHDHDRFAEPDRFDIGRDCRGHVGFGLGPALLPGLAPRAH